MVLRLKTEIGVERGFVFRVGGLEPVGHVSEGLDHVVDLFLGEDLPLSVRRGGELLAGGCRLVLGGGDPAGYDRGVGFGIQCDAVSVDAAIRLGDGPPCGFQGGAAAGCRCWLSHTARTVRPRCPGAKTRASHVSSAGRIAFWRT
ncbi:hypothetical protein [Streptomyces sioyaensis]|uniref:hypothetical protein n=1 Tax=Streptomyces sioyaensis TaxID=67364 RepID=UPI0037953E02